MRWQKVLLALLLGLLIPFPQPVVPAWTSVVVNEAGAPQANIAVREVWQQYSLESQHHQEELRTDASGRVSFPRRTLWRPYAFNIAGVLRKSWSDPNKAAFGPVAYLLATPPGAQAFADYCMKCAEPAPARIVLHEIHVFHPQ